MSTRRCAAALGLLIVLGSATAFADGGPTATSAGERGLIARSSGHSSELVDTVEIEKSAQASRTTVISIGPSRLPPLRPGARLTASAEVQLTMTCVRPGERCVGSPYRYNPQFGAQLFLSRSQGSVGGIPLSARLRTFCSQEVARRNHHCPLVLDGTELRIPAEADLPCPPDRCFVNLVVDASHPDAGDGDKVIIGIDSESGQILQDKGRVNVILRNPGTEVDTDAIETRDRRAGEIEMTAGGSGERSVVYSAPLRGLAVGDVIDVRALLVTEISQLDYAAFIGNQLIVSDSRAGEHPGPIAKRAITSRGEISEMNGFNCTQEGTPYSTPCKSPKTGVAVVRREPTGPLYVNLVARAFPKRVGEQPNDVAKVEPQGYLRVKRLHELP